MSLFQIAYEWIVLPLVLTILIELGVWKGISLFFKRYALPLFFLSIIAVNLFTNPLLNVFLYFFDAWDLGLLIILEVIVIFVEAFIFYKIYKKSFIQFLILATVLNACSFILGLIIL